MNFIANDYLYQKIFYLKIIQFSDHRSHQGWQTFLKPSDKPQEGNISASDVREQNFFSVS